MISKSHIYQKAPTTTPYIYRLWQQVTEIWVESILLSSTVSRSFIISGVVSMIISFNSEVATELLRPSETSNEVARASETVTALDVDSEAQKKITLPSVVDG